MLVSLRGIMYNVHDSFGYSGIMYNVHDSFEYSVIPPIILTCLYHLPHQTYTTPWHVILNEHAPMSESESEVWVWAKKKQPFVS